MGKVADSAVERRRARRADGLARRAVLRVEVEADRRARVAVAEVRRAVRTQELAQQAIDAADERAKTAVRGLSDDGLAQTEIAARCGVPLWTVRRLLALTTPTGPDAALTGEH